MPFPIRYSISILLIAVLALGALGDATVSLCLPYSTSMNGCKGRACCCRTDGGSTAACCAKKGGEGICFSPAGCFGELPPAFQVPLKDDALASFVFVLQNDKAQERNTSRGSISYNVDIPVDLFHPPQSWLLTVPILN